MSNYCFLHLINRNQWNTRNGIPIPPSSLPLKEEKASSNPLLTLTDCMRTKRKRGKIQWRLKGEGEVCPHSFPLLFPAKKWGNLGRWL